MRPPDEDRLAAARAADALNRSLDDARYRDTPAPGDRELDAAVRRINEIAATNVPAHVIRSAEDRLWEDLMQRHITAAPTPGPAAIPADAVTRQDDLRWRPRIDRPAQRSVRVGHRIGHRVMGLVATLTIVALIGLSGLAVYLNIPDGGGEPTSMAAVGMASPSVSAENLIPADSVRRALPLEAYSDVPPAETYGDGWRTFGSPSYTLVPGTTSQVDTYPFVNDFGSRIQIQLVHYTDKDEEQAVFDWFATRLDTMQQQFDATRQLVTGSDFDSGKLLDGCRAVARAAGYETITGFPVEATACLVPERSLVVYAVFNGYPLELPYSLPVGAPNLSETIMTAVLSYQLTVATPVATP